MRSHSIWFLLAGLVLVAGCGGKTAAVPRAWQAVTLATDAEFSDVWFADDRNGWAVGGGYDIEGGLIGRTRDGGQTWKYASGFVSRWPGVSSFHFTAVQFFDSLSGCTIGDGGQIFRTDDGGENWRLVRYGGGEGLTDLFFVDRDYGWAVGGAGVLRTVDGGEHWQWAARSTSENGYLGGSAVQFLDRSTGWMTSLRQVLRTSDGGVTWTSIPIPLAQGENPHLYDLHFPDPRHGWVVGENGTILATADAGFTWVRQRNGIPVPKRRPLQLIRKSHGVDTIDTEELEGPRPGLLLTAVHFLDTNRGWTIGFFPDQGRSLILRTVDGGAAWTEEGEAKGQELRGLFVKSDGRGWTIGDRARAGDQVLLRRAAEPPAAVAAGT